MYRLLKALQLITPAVAFDPDYQALLNYVTSKGWSLPSSPQQSNQNTLVQALKAGGNPWAKMDRLFIHANNANQDFSVTNWVSPSDATLATRVNSPIWTANQGFTGVPVSEAHINTNFNPTIGTPKYSQNSASIFIWVRQATTGSFGIAGQEAGTSRILVNNQNGSANRLNSSAGITADFSGTGFFHIARISSTDVEVFRNGASLGVVSNTSASPPMVMVTILRSITNYSDAQISLFGIGSNMSGDNATLYNAFNNYINGL